MYTFTYTYNLYSNISNSTLKSNKRLRSSNTIIIYGKKFRLWLLIKHIKPSEYIYQKDTCAAFTKLFYRR